MESDLRYQSGFGNQFSSESLAGALPIIQNSPQRAPYGLYAEQFSGSAFSAPRDENMRSWLYRIRPSVMHGEFVSVSKEGWCTGPFYEVPPSPNPLRWDPIPFSNEKTDLLNGTQTLSGNGTPDSPVGGALHVFRINKNMESRCFYNADGEMFFVPYQGQLLFQTEFGWFELSTDEIGVIPRGTKFRCEPKTGECRGYIGENYGAPFRLPYLGPIGSNGLANPRDFLYPIAAYEDKDTPFELFCKFQGGFWRAKLDHSPFDVVAWHGNYAPYKYDLNRFNTIYTVSFDHPDPSLFTVLTSPSGRAGVPNLDFVIFPPRWMVAEHTFRPPYYHRNRMSEFMGLIKGVYDAKSSGFVPGGTSLHNCMSAHGPDAETFKKGSEGELKPQYISNTLAFMFESSEVFRPTAFAMSTPALQKDYLSCWAGLPKRYNPGKR